MAMAPNQKKTAAIGSAEFKSRCLELVDRVKEARAEYIVTRHGRPVAKLVPIDADEPSSPFGSMAGTVLAYDGPFDPVPGAWALAQPDDAD